ncbi:hypothetical protein [Kitasatospora camelliae]|uniref:Integral membrane protein n=1 Tax=Kitasatospora camelliae TaxID=3156397 RepID=A0AAU8JW78_9ACTN
MAEQQQVCCPGCGGAEGVVSARAAHGGGADRAPVVGLAPPPPPPTTAPAGQRQELRAGAKAVIAVCALLASSSLLRTLTDDTVYTGAYGAGQNFAKVLPVLVLAATWYFGRRTVPGPEPELVVRLRAEYTRRMQVWEHARYCTACRTAFWPAGVLRPDFPASPPVPQEQFPLMVATMADRAYGETRWAGTSPNTTTTTTAKQA